MNKLDAQTVQLAGVNLIEASAGTGKTYTLAELYCRLVIEKNLEVKQILVVTYTRAATEELRGRLRQKLVDERQKRIKAGEADTAELKRLQLAIQSFDEAAIFTIHGFCQRALQDFAFESGHFFDMEMITDELSIKQGLVDDFWRQHIATSDADFARYLLIKKQTPETLLHAIESLTGKPYLKLLPLADIDFEQARQQAQQHFATIKSSWQQHDSFVIDTLTDSNLLNGNKYRKNSVMKWLISLEQMLDNAVMPDQVFDELDRFTRARLEPALKKNQVLPEHPFWAQAQAFLEAHQLLQQAFELRLQRLRLELVDYLAVALPERKQQLKVQAFDDLLLNLQQALHDTQATQLITQIRHQFRAALIDEFQDTDPVQYDCFHRIFAESDCPVFFVGDPKQAIYSFRGADIFTYLQAKKAATNEYNLDTNWRSHPLLVNAVNGLFQRVDKPFLYDAIPFYPVKASRPNQPNLLIQGQPVVPVEFVWTASETDKPIGIGDMQQQAAWQTAVQIAELMLQSGQGDVQLTDKNEQTRALNGGDIAVLVRSHKQASLIQQMLQKVGVNSVMQSRETVFASEQAILFEQVLAAIAKPTHDSLVATALASPIFNQTALEIYQLQQDDAAWLAQTDSFISLHETWQRQGFMVMFHQLMEQFDVAHRLLAIEQGERQLTNFLHLAELTQHYANKQNHAIDAVLSWLASERQAAATGQETAQIRLESDEQLVKIITIHTSKGLEYPIVFCPFLWHQASPRQKPALLFFHDGENNTPSVALGEPAWSAGEAIAAEEQRAEDLRLLYVALTRARERCVISWGPAVQSQNTALFSLLHSPMDKLDQATMKAELQHLAAQYPAEMSLSEATDLATQFEAPAATTHLEFQAKLFHGGIPAPWQIGSFTGLSRGQHIEQPDHDADTVTTELVVNDTTQADRFGFPRGANAGTCLHSLFEHWDFQEIDADWQQQVSRTLMQFGIDSDWQTTTINWLDEVVHTQLQQDSALSLSAIDKNKRLDEMAFYFPVSQLTPHRLQHHLTPFIDELPALKPILASLNFDGLVGFMKGFIDLVFEYDGQFYIADYKSNYLGHDAEAYQPERLTEAMIAHAYPLQYLIYSLALHRYLTVRLDDYDPEQHFGGVYYLFIRGMKPEWGQAGVYFDRPSPALLNALDQCMQEHD